MAMVLVLIYLFLSKCFVQIINGTRTKNVHDIGILLQHCSKDFREQGRVGIFRKRIQINNMQDSFEM